MIMRNNITELLKGVEVEWKTLGEVAEVGTGNANRQDEDEHGQYPFYVRSKNILKSKKFQFDETSIVIPGEGGIGDIFHYIEGKYALHQRAYRIHVFSNKLNTKYLYYLMCDKFKQYILTKCVGATSISIRKPMLEQFQIPIPPLHIQTEIVRILDTFTALTAELTAELATRKKQYNYYLDKLLTFKEDEVEWKALGDVFNIFAGGDVPKDALSEKESKQFNIPILSNGIGSKSLYGWTNIPKINKPSLTISARGTIGWANYQEKPFYPVVRLLVLTPKTKVNLKYTYYFMKYIENDYKVPKSGIPQLTKPMIKDKSIPIPPLKEQARIVEILDKFDALTNSITEGLPREIALRQKQYEYYRNLLLDFPKVQES
ncbi:restriction endonuclease subunit S [Gilliamella sp. Imp1-6]|nr:restriction endonuclease subunit S [Gilliamella apicola]